MYFQGGVDQDNQLRDAEGDVIAMPSGDGWTSIPSGGYVEVSIAQRKLGDPLVMTYDLYNAEGQLTDVWQPAVVDGDLNSPTYGQSVMPHWHYGYDAEGNQITQTSPTGHDASGAVVSGGNTTTFGFDQNGNQVRQTLPDGEVETWAYNANNQLASSTDFDGNTATYTYATSGTHAGDLMSVVYAGSGKATQSVTYTYDDLNRQHTVTDASGTTTSFYDVEGNLAASYTPEGDIHYVFDLATGDHTETYTAYTDTIYGYDSQNRLTSVTVTTLNGVSAAPLTGVPSSITLSGFDDSNLDGTLMLTADTGGTGVDGSEFINDQSFAGQLGVRLADGSGVDLYAANGGFVLNVYDVTSFPGDGGDFTLTLDSHLRVISQLVQDDVYQGNDADGDPIVDDYTFTVAPPASAALTTTYTYDAAGNKKTETLPDGEVTTYTYDDLNRLTGQTEAQGGTTLFSETFILNDDGTRRSATESQLQPDGSTVTTETAWTYDADGRLTSETVEAPGTVATPQGLATTLTLPADYNVENGTPDTLTWNGTNAYVSAGVTESGAHDEVLLDPAAAAADGGNGSDWVLVVASDDSQDQDYESFTLSNGTFTPDGVVNEGRDFGGTPTFTVAAAAGFDYANNYSYDLDNNRVQSIHVGPEGGANETITYVYNGDDELIHQTSSLSGLTTNVYDPNGSLTTSTAGGETTTYTYDSRNKMVGYADGTNTATYVYDDGGDRVNETANGITTLYLTDTENPTGYDQPVEQRSSATGAPTLTYILGDRVLGQASAAGQVTYLLVDGHGSTQQMTSASGAVTAAFRYDAFGTALNFDAGTAGTTILFGGDAIYDPVSGLYQHSNGRPTLGFVFTQMNSPGYSSNTDPASLHNYSYADANPVDGHDPSGNDDIGADALSESNEDVAEDTAGLDAVYQYLGQNFGRIGAYTQASFAAGQFAADNLALDQQALFAPLGGAGGEVIGEAAELLGDSVNTLLGAYSEASSAVVSSLESVSELASEAGEAIEGGAGAVEQGVQNIFNPTGGGSNCVRTTIAVIQAALGKAVDVPEDTGAENLFSALEETFGNANINTSHATSSAELEQSIQFGCSSPGDCMAISAKGHAFSAVNSGGSIYLVDMQQAITIPLTDSARVFRYLGDISSAVLFHVKG